MREAMDLILGRLDDNLTAAQFDQLQRLLSESAEARQLYRDTIDRCVSLRSVLRSTGSVEGSVGSGFGVRQRVQGSGFRVQEKESAIRNPKSAIPLALAAAIALALTAWFLFTPNPQPPTPSPSPRAPHAVALLSDLSADAVFAAVAPGSDRPPTLGADLPPGPIQLTAGKAQIMFNSTTVVDLTGPCAFEMTGPNRGRLTAGSLEAYVPDRARGFTVDLPLESRVVDLGTRFRVHVDPMQQSSIYVADGRVQIHNAQQVMQVVAGQTVRIESPRRLVRVGPVADQDTVVFTSDFSDAAVGVELTADADHVAFGWHWPGASAAYPRQASVVNRASGRADTSANPAMRLGPWGEMRRVNLDLRDAAGLRQAQPSRGRTVTLAMRFEDTDDDDWFGIFWRDGRADGIPYRLQFNGRSGLIVLRKNNEQLFSARRDVSGAHHLQLCITFDENQNTLEVLLDGESIGVGVDRGQDGSPPLTPTGQSSITLSNFNGEPTARILLDDVSLSMRRQ